MAKPPSEDLTVSGYYCVRYFSSHPHLGSKPMLMLAPIQQRIITRIVGIPDILPTCDDSDIGSCPTQVLQADTCSRYTITNETA